MNAEEKRLKESTERKKHWKRWGPYLSERAWGTVREDYSPHGSAWDYFPHEHARSRAYRWNEDGIAGISDRHQKICFALSFWNGRDPILKERIFGLTGSEGNHGEDVKELYYYLDSTPTHSYMKFLYKYPQNEFPYARLIEENRNRSKQTGEFELMDTGVFDEDKYFDCFVEYAKADDGRYFDKNHDRQSRRGRCEDKCFADGLVSQYLVMGKFRVKSSKFQVGFIAGRFGANYRTRNRRIRHSVFYIVKMPTNCFLRKTIPTSKNFTARKMRARLSKTASMITSSTAIRARSIRQNREQKRRQIIL